MSELSNDYKARIVEAIKSNAFKFKTNKAQAVSLGIHPAQFSRILNGETGSIVSDAKWNEIASKYNVPVNKSIFIWQTAKTAVFEFITGQLEACQEMGISGIFCDASDIGKSYAAKDYVSKHRNAIYVDCSRHKSRTELIRAMCKEFGINSDVSITRLKEDLIQYMRSMSSPLVILDEFGDLSYPAFLEVKALWNATEYRTGWYMMGADGLKVKLDRKKEMKKVGFAETFSRLGSRYQRVTPENEQERLEFLKAEVAKVTKANNSSLTPREMFGRTMGSLRRVYIEIKREKTDLNNIEVELS